MALWLCPKIFPLLCLFAGATLRGATPFWPIPRIPSQLQTPSPGSWLLFEPGPEESCGYRDFRFYSDTIHPMVMSSIHRWYHPSIHQKSRCHPSIGDTQWWETVKLAIPNLFFSHPVDHPVDHSAPLGSYWSRGHLSSQVGDWWLVGISQGGGVHKQNGVSHNKSSTKSETCGFCR